MSVPTQPTLFRSLVPALLLLLAQRPTWAGDPVIASARLDGSQVAGNALHASISKNGRFIAFTSYGVSGLATSDTNGFSDVYVKDLKTGVIEHISVDGAGVPANAASWGPQISPDGRSVGFLSNADNLFAGTTLGVTQVYIHDRVLHSTSLASRNYTTGLGANTAVISFAMNDDSNEVAYVTAATNLVANDPAGSTDVFIAHRSEFSLERISVAPNGDAQNGDAYYGIAMTPNGRQVAFESDSTNLVLDLAPNAMAVYLRDLDTGVTIRVSRMKNGSPPTINTWLLGMSPDARVFALGAGQSLIPSQAIGDLFLVDLVKDEVSPLGRVAGQGVITAASRVGLSKKGRKVAFDSIVANGDDANGAYDVFLLDRTTGKTKLVSKGDTHGAGNGSSRSPAITPNGKYVAFVSSTTDFGVADQNGTYDDVFRIKP